MNLYPYMVSLGMPEGITDEQQSDWLREQFRELVAQGYRRSARVEEQRDLAWLAFGKRQDAIRVFLANGLKDCDEWDVVQGEKHG